LCASRERWLTRRAPHAVPAPQQLLTGQGSLKNSEMTARLKQSLR
jgi:hypothetical protein